MLNQKILLRFFILVSVLIAVAVILISPWSLSLNKIHSGIETTYRNVQHLDPITLSEISADEVVIFDVREPDEFNVSHIKGAIQLEPDIDPEEFKYEFAEIISDKIVVFYCSVGLRSSAQASQLRNALYEANAVKIFNLKGGVFQWHNELRPLVKGHNISTRKIHPYNDYWGQLIKNQSLVSYF